MLIHDVDDTTTKLPDPPVGWRCPVCGCGNAPWVSQCPCMQTQHVPIYPQPWYPDPQPQPWYPDPYSWCGL